MIATEIGKICRQALQSKVFPGCCVGFVVDGKSQLLPFGQLRYTGNVDVTAHTMYDVASVTKSIPTASIILKLVEEGRLKLDDRVVNFLPELRCADREKILVRHLLTYTAVFELPGGLGEFALEYEDKTIDELMKCELKAEPGTTYHYTNAPALLAGLMVERVVGQQLDQVARDMFFEPLGLSHSTFRPTIRTTCAPSEADWRGELCRQVEDESAWVLAQSGQVSGHAGLFSCARDMLIFARMLAEDGEFDGKKYFHSESIRMMHTNQIEALGGATGMGWEIQRPYMGSKGSGAIFGKAGFWSSMVVIDPRKHAALVHLSNANYPHRATDGKAINAVRQALADAVFGDAQSGGGR